MTATCRDGLSAALDAIRERCERDDPGRFPNVPGSHQDVPRLLTAVDAVLARHVPAPVTVRELCREHGASEHIRRLPWADEQAIIDACPDCKKTECISCTACDPACPDTNVWPCEDVKVITRALAGDA